MVELLAHPDLFTMDEKTLEVCEDGITCAAISIMPTRTLPWLKLTSNSRRRLFFSTAKQR
jgi:hypothetical protein